MRKLRLHHELLSDLTSDEIKGIAGGPIIGTQSCFTDCMKLTCAAAGCGDSIFTCYVTCGCIQ